MLFVCSSEASKHTSVQDVRYFSYKSHTRVVVDLDGHIDFTRNRLANPDRIFFDLKNCSLSKNNIPSLDVKDNIINNVRFAQFDKSTVRVVIDLKNSKDFSAYLLENPHRLVVDVYAGEAKGGLLLEPLEVKKTPGNKFMNNIRTVVIDAGHGGKDPGAVGLRGLREKDITLSVGKKLGKIIEKKHGVNVIYTRTRDRFVSLNKRTQLANSSKADLFISIHTNASKRRGARGIETYFLNWTNEDQAMKVAARENGIPLWKMKKQQGGLKMILQDLARSNKKEESMRLAYNVQNAMINTLKKDYHRIEDHGVKFALFYVLVGAEMPSILVEISFISNRDEEKRLANNRYRDKVAEAIAKGVNAYISESTLIVQPVVNSISEG
ncbi:N-acetylmuramoyl-L-alanine amidase AmiC precursor [bacterium BMS3Abin09]|nr:N-acetylmuramoyl-L-alanine amidase AmiC precursor [bacterium BMS3Abin09]GBE41638.1 N-acetylmuramoyl-L-alanine amidase AmiC precursor [bacterium BMS3Bbin09]